MGSNEPPFFHESFDFLFLCYSHQCLSLSKCIFSQHAVKQFLRVELRVANAGFGTGGRGHFKFFNALIEHFCIRTPLLNLLDPPLNHPNHTHSPPLKYQYYQERLFQVFKTSYMYTLYLTEFSHTKLPLPALHMYTYLAHSHSTYM